MKNLENESSRIRVGARVRPLSERTEKQCVFMDSKDSSVHVNNHKFHLDHTFDQNTAQNDVYNQSVKNLVNKVLSGFNATVFAYGQTGSGKTFTMGTREMTDDEQSYGIIPRVIQDILCHSKREDGLRIQISFVEIYNEVVKDLLHPSTPASQFFVYESGNGQVTLSGVQMEPISSLEEGLNHLRTGICNRKTNSHMLNNRSSRSHCIFTLYLFKEEVLYSKFHLVDLAGSERSKRTCTKTCGVRETSNINKSLLVLTKVISSLASQSKKSSKRNSVFVPYRDSKLTRLLKDSLGGECLTLMLVCISPSTLDYAETLNSLRYAVGARGIRNKPQVQRVNIVKKNCRDAKRQRHVNPKRMVVKGPPVSPVRKYVPKNQNQNTDSQSGKNPTQSVRELEKSRNQPLSSLSLEQIRRLKRDVHYTCSAELSNKSKSGLELKGEVQRLQKAFSKLEGETSKSLFRGSSMPKLKSEVNTSQVHQQKLNKPGSAPSKNSKNNHQFSSNNQSVKQQFNEYKKKIKSLENNIKKIKTEKKSSENALKREKRKNERIEAEKSRLNRQMKKMKTAHNERISTLENQNRRLHNQVKEQSRYISRMTQQRKHHQKDTNVSNSDSSNLFRSWKTSGLNKVQCRVLASSMAIPTSS
eukprot:gb/GECH01014207.1/.p1 GENE.gb/GECH01014207.1/~~gb/GECH01014207.1/.p1  ORF type:complete len:642 (+),score=121.76 gb/GECH01014207.1/:1-1926(+)